MCTFFEKLDIFSRGPRLGRQTLGPRLGRKTRGPPRLSTPLDVAIVDAVLRSSIGRIISGKRSAIAYLAK